MYIYIFLDAQLLEVGLTGRLKSLIPGQHKPECTRSGFKQLVFFKIKTIQYIPRINTALLPIITKKELNFCHKL